MNTKTFLRGALLCAALAALGMAADSSAAPQAAPAKEKAHSAAGGERAARSSSININTADAQSLADGLVGIGLSKAQLIVAYRKEHGKFDSADQLGDVQGIGKKTMEKNRARIVLK